MTDPTPYIPEHSAEVATDLAEQFLPPVRVTTGTKAFVGAIVGGLSAGGSALVQAIASEGVITGGEWVTVIVAIAVGAGLVGPSVYAATNKPVA